MNRSEAARIVSNYVRLCLTFVVGLALVRLILSLGENTFAVYMLITVGFGITVMLRELARIAIIPPLTQNLYSSDDQASFSELFSAAQVCCIGLVLLGGMVFGLIYAALAVFAIPAELEHAAAVFLFCRFLQLCTTVGLMPSLGLFLATQRQVQYNVVLSLERLMELAAAFIAVHVAQTQGAAAGLVSFAIWSTVLLMTVQIGAAIWVTVQNSDLNLRIKIGRKADVFRIMNRMGWSSAIVAAMNLYLRFDILLVNIVFGPIGTAIFGVVVQVIGYIRQLTAGLVQGLDAVVARFSSDNSIGRAKPKPIDMIKVTTALQGLIIALTVGYLMLTLTDLLWLWLGDSLSNAQASIAQITTLSLIMAVGIGFRGFSESWMQAMAGVGRVDAYAKWLLPGAILNAVLAVVIYLIWPEASLVVLAVLFTVLQFLVHGLILPVVAARTLQTDIMSLIKPLATPILLSTALTIVAWQLDLGLFATTALFAVGFVVGLGFIAKGLRT